MNSSSYSISLGLTNSWITDNRVDYRSVSCDQNEIIFYCNDFQLQELIDIKSRENSSYIRSSTEPFDDEMALDQRTTGKKAYCHAYLHHKLEYRFSRICMPCCTKYN